MSFNALCANSIAHLDRPRAGGEAVLYALLSYHVTGLQVDVADQAAVGDDLAVTAMVQTDGQPGRHVLHVSLAGPDGTINPAYERNVVADGGRWTGTLELAENDPAGAWSLVVRDATGGMWGQDHTCDVSAVRRRSTS